MNRELKDKVAVITGGADGIGFKIAENFIKNGVKLTLILDINEELGNKAINELTNKYGVNRAVFIKCDVYKDLDIVSQAIFSKYNYVDILVNNAGVCNELNIRKTIEINVIALMEWSMKFREHMRTDKGGKGGTIINLSSVYGFRTDQFVPYYIASKHAVMGFTKSLGHEYNFERTAVRVVAICPGYTETNMPKNSILPDDMIEDYKEYWANEPRQNVDAVGAAAVEVFRRADSGTAWLIEGGNVEQLP